VALHNSLESLADPAGGEGVAGVNDRLDDRLDNSEDAYEGAWTSTCWPGTKWAAEMDVPASGQVAKVSLSTPQHHLAEAETQHTRLNDGILGDPELCDAHRGVDAGLLELAEEG
jgi:hypothetical protein